MYDVTAENNEIKNIMYVQSTTEMRYRISGNIFIDCTGNGTLGYYAGAEFRQRSESKAETGEPHAPKKATMREWVIQYC